MNLQEENNNNVVSPGNGGGVASDVVTSSTAPLKNATSLQDSRAKKFTIAAANPLLAGMCWYISEHNGKMEVTMFI